MKIAYVCTENLPVPPVKGGAVQTHIAGILPVISRLHDVTVFCVEAEELPNEETEDGVTYIRLPAPDREQYLANVRSALARKRFDLVHVFNRPAWVPVLSEAAFGARFCLRVHNSMFEPDKITQEAAEAAIQIVAAIDTVSDFIGRKIAARFPEAVSKLRTVYSGVDVERFAPIWSRRGQKLRRQMREKLGLKDAPVVLYVGRLSPNKGPHLLIPMMERVLEEVPDAVLVIVGSRWFGQTERCEYSDELEKTVRSLGLEKRVRFTGYVPALEVEKYFVIGDVFICTSQWEEPLARVHYEAMGAGLPIVTTARGGNPEVVYPEVNGYVVHDAENPHAFAEKVIQLLKDSALLESLGRRGRLMAETRFSFVRAAAETLEIYDRIMWY